MQQVNGKNGLTGFKEDMMNAKVEVRLPGVTPSEVFRAVAALGSGDPACPTEPISRGPQLREALLCSHEVLNETAPTATAAAAARPMAKLGVLQMQNLQFQTQTAMGHVPSIFNLMQATREDDEDIPTESSVLGLHLA